MKSSHGSLQKIIRPWLLSRSDQRSGSRTFPCCSSDSTWCLFTMTAWSMTVDVGSCQQWSVTCTRWEINYWPIRIHRTDTFPQVPAWPVTNLRREDVVSHIPDPLSSVDIGIAHSLHFGEDWAHCCVSGLVSSLIDEHPPVRGSESVCQACQRLIMPLLSTPSNKPHRWGHVHQRSPDSASQSLTSAAHLWWCGWACATSWWLSLCLYHHYGKSDVWNLNIIIIILEFKCSPCTLMDSLWVRQPHASELTLNCL